MINKSEKFSDLKSNQITSKFSNLFKNYEDKITKHTNPIIRNENKFYSNNKQNKNNPNPSFTSFPSFTGGKNYEKKEENFEMNFNEKLFKETEKADKLYSLIPTEKLENLNFLKENYCELFNTNTEICFRLYELSNESAGLAISQYKYGKVFDFIEENNCFVIKLDKIKYDYKSDE